jgi:hypothetical protein
MSKQTIGPKFLLKKLLFQMDNCVKDNNNLHLLAFFPQVLTMREVFEEVQLGFLQLVIHMKTLTDALGICQKS